MKQSAKKYFAMVIGDCFLIAMALLLAFELRLGAAADFTRSHALHGVLVVVVYLLSFYVADLYDLRRDLTHHVTLSRSLVAVASGTLVLASCFYLLPAFKLGRGILFLCGVYLACFIALSRLVGRVFLGAVPSRRVLMLGQGASNADLVRKIAQKRIDVRIVGLLTDKPLPPNPVAPVLGRLSAIAETISRESITEVIVEDGQAPEIMRQLLRARLNGVRVWTVRYFYTEMLGQMPVEYLDDAHLAFSDGFELFSRPLARHLKRLMDVWLSLVLLVAAAPVMLLAAVAIKITSRGSVFFRQERVGEGERVFELIKFRSMYQQKRPGSERWAASNDSRITPVGRWLRRLHIDELPQAINILRGDMSFIGPRPEQPQLVDALREKIPYYSLRHSVRPGLTGWAQVNAGYADSVESSKEKLCYDLHYIRNYSVALDLMIMLMTTKLVLISFVPSRRRASADRDAASLAEPEVVFKAAAAGAGD